MVSRRLTSDVCHHTHTLQSGSNKLGPGEVDDQAQEEVRGRKHQIAGQNHEDTPADKSDGGDGAAGKNLVGVVVGCHCCSNSSILGEKVLDLVHSLWGSLRCVSNCVFKHKIFNFWGN